MNRITLLTSILRSLVGVVRLVRRMSMPQVCLRGGRDCFPSPGVAGPPPRGFEANQDFARELSGMVQSLGGGLAHRAEFIRVLFEKFIDWVFT